MFLKDEYEHAFKLYCNDIKNPHVNLNKYLKIHVNANASM
jgi:hypothetical protein